MLIPVRLPAASLDQSRTTEDGLDGGTEEWSLIELNGTLSSTKGDGALGGSQLGHLSFTADGKPVLVIGANKLEGEVVRLSKPLIIIDKKEASVSMPHQRLPTAEPTPGSSSEGPFSPQGTYAGLGFSSPDSVRMSLTPGFTPDSNSLVTCGTEYHVKGVVRQKLLFASRPKPIVARHLLPR